jgi:putative spermidine/putrescine transport system ATP-binding protein
MHSAETKVAVSFQSTCCYFGSVKAVDNISLDIYHGEFFTLLGPSGSGKTTCLRLIAGFEQPTTGHIQLYGVPVEGTPPYERDVNTVFQDYALFPHMNVGENIAYGLMIRKVPPAERQRRVAEMLELVQLPGISERRPSQLSGGQKQRVALARALINEPRVLLLDEPLGALDLKLRQQMQVELKAIQRRVGITFVFVTHDQEEALTMSDRIAIFNQGQIEQIGTPVEVYEHPASAFVAGFVGTSNLMDENIALAVTGERCHIAVRPEKIRLCGPQDPVPDTAYSLLGTISEVIYLGVNTRYIVTLEGGSEIAVLQQNLDSGSGDVLAARGKQVRLMWDKAHTLRLD